MVIVLYTLNISAWTIGLFSQKFKRAENLNIHVISKLLIDNHPEVYIHRNYPILRNMILHLNLLSVSLIKTICKCFEAYCKPTKHAT